MVEKEIKETKKPNRTNYIIAFIVALTSPLIVLGGLAAGILGLAYDVPRATPTPIQGFFSTAAQWAVLGYLLLGPLFSIAAIVLASIDLGGKKNYNKWVFVIVGTMLVISVLIWIFGVLGLPPEAYR